MWRIASAACSLAVGCCWQTTDAGTSVSIIRLTRAGRGQPIGRRAEHVWPLYIWPAGQFLTIVSATLVRQGDSCWTRGARVRLSGITWSLIQEALATPDAVIKARTSGPAKDGGLACMTVPPLDGGWCLVPKRSTGDTPEPSPQ